MKQAYPIRLLSLFGSYSQNDQHNKSDIDILVEFEKPVGVEFIELAEELEALLGQSVDFVSKQGVKEQCLRKINNDLMYV